MQKKKVIVQHYDCIIDFLINCGVVQGIKSPKLCVKIYILSNILTNNFNLSKFEVIYWFYTDKNYTCIKKNNYHYYKKYFSHHPFTIGCASAQMVLIMSGSAVP